MPLTRGLNKPPIRDGILNKELDCKYKVIAEMSPGAVDCNVKCLKALYFRQFIQSAEVSGVRANLVMANKEHKLYISSLLSLVTFG